MRRVVSLYLPTWPTDRIRRKSGGSPPPGEPLVTVAQSGSRRVIASVDARARELGITVGMTAAHAQALVPGLHAVPATPAEDVAGLERLTVWCMRYSPLVAVDPPEGIFIDIAGAAHLFRGEDRLLADLTKRLNGKGLAARAVVADTFAAAWGIARYGTDTIVAPGRLVDAVAPLPVASLRFSGETVDCLRELGFEASARSRPSHPALFDDASVRSCACGSTRPSARSLSLSCS